MEALFAYTKTSNNIDSNITQKGASTEKNLRTITRIHQSTLGRNAALALTTEVHHLLHSEGEVGNLLRDLDRKGLLKVMVVPKPNKGEHTISSAQTGRPRKTTISARYSNRRQKSCAQK